MKPKMKHRKSIKGLFRHQKDTLSIRLEYGKNFEFKNIIGFSYADFVKDHEFRMSTIYILIIYGCVVS